MNEVEPRTAIEDLTRDALSDLPQWTPDDVRGSLRAVFETYVTDHITDSIDWYFHRRGRKRRLGFAVRLGAIAAAGAGVTIPVLASLWTDDAGVPMVSAGWTAIALLLGAGLIWVDGFLDGTSGWLRYATTGLALTELRDDAVLRWLAEETQWTGEPDDAQITDALTLIRDLNAHANTIVREETAAWRTQFQGRCVSSTDCCARGSTKVRRRWSRSVSATAPSAPRAARCRSTSRRRRASSPRACGSSPSRDDARAMNGPARTPSFSICVRRSTA